MVAKTEELISEDRAYMSEGQGLYHILIFPDYCALSGADADEMLARARFEVAPWEHDPNDNAL